MYRQEIFRVLYDKYEHFIVDRDFRIIEHSDHVFHLFEVSDSLGGKTDIFEWIPELVGTEDALQQILDGEEKSFVIPNVFKVPESYINIHIHQGKEYRASSNGNMRYETLIILLEDVTKDIEEQKRIYHERNEKVLLLNEIAEKNIQLKRFNEQMQELVEIETKKNLEKQKMLELQSRYAQMGEMIGMITHQWKQPLHTISMMASGLQLKDQLGKIDETTIPTFTRKLHEQTEYMNQTISDFQHFFNPVKEKMHFNLYQTISSVVELIRYECEMNRIGLELSGDETLLVHGFPNEYSQVVLTVLSNAKDAFLAAPHEHMKISITIAAHHEKDSIVTIQDNAGGIPDDIIDTIFDIYMTTKPTGSGLGLNIAKNIIEGNMDGALTVCNTGDGAAFSIVI